MNVSIIKDIIKLYGFMFIYRFNYVRVNDVVLIKKELFKINAKIIFVKGIICTKLFKLRDISYAYIIMFNNLYNYMTMIIKNNLLNNYKFIIGYTKNNIYNVLTYNILCSFNSKKLLIMLLIYYFKYIFKILNVILDNIYNEKNK